MSIIQPLVICMEDQEMKEVKERSVKLLTVMHFQENQKHNADYLPLVSKLTN